MRAVVMTGYGAPDKLELRELSDPTPGPGEVRIKAAATSVNPVDWKIRSGLYKSGGSDGPPMVLGRDVAGEVSALGPGVTGFALGDRVMGMIQHGYAEQVVAKASDLARVPRGLPLEQAAALPLVVTTGTQLIEDQTRPEPGSTVLVTGAVGGVGRAAVFAAKQRGAKVLAGVRSSQLAEAAKLGADAVVAIDDDGAIAGLPELDAIADTVGGATIGKLLPHLKKGGTLGSVLGAPAAAKGLDLEVRAFSAHPDGQRLETLAQAVERGALQIPIGKKLPLAQASEAHREGEHGGAGKIVLTM